VIHGAIVGPTGVIWDAKPLRPLLLDTHIWIWVAENLTAKLSTSCIDGIRLARRQERLLVSAISVWEVAILDAKGRITLSANCHEWVNLGIKGQKY